MPKYWTGAKRELDGRIIYRAKRWNDFRLSTICYEISQSTYNFLKLFVILEFSFAIGCIIYMKLTSPHSSTTLLIFLLQALGLGLIVQVLKNKFVVHNNFTSRIKC